MKKLGSLQEICLAFVRERGSDHGMECGNYSTHRRVMDSLARRGLVTRRGDQYFAVKEAK